MSEEKNTDSAIKFIHVKDLKVSPPNTLANIKIMTFSYYNICIIRITNDIFLPQIERTVTAEYELEYLLLEGHCLDIKTQQPPRGLQFTLGTKNQSVIVDTIVMANLVSIIKQLMVLKLDVLVKSSVFLIIKYLVIAEQFPKNKIESLSKSLNKANRRESYFQNVPSS